MLKNRLNIRRLLPYCFRVLPDTCVEQFVNFTSTPVAIIDKELHKRSIISFRMSRPAYLKQNQQIAKSLKKVFMMNYFRILRLRFVILGLSNFI